MKETDDRIRAAMDLVAVMVAEEIAKEYHCTESEALTRFLSSGTGMNLYDDSMKYWWLGPSDIVELYKEEVAE